jgi:hypothetical protein
VTRRGANQGGHWPGTAPSKEPAIRGGWGGFEVLVGDDDVGALEVVQAVGMIVVQMGQHQRFEVLGRVDAE